MNRPTRLLKMGDESDPRAVTYTDNCVNLLNKNFYACIAWAMSLLAIFALLNFVPFFRP